MVGLSCAAGSWTWLPGPFAVIPFVVSPFVYTGLDVLFEDGFVKVAEALELPSVVREFVVSELFASGTSSLLPLLVSCGGLKPEPWVGLLLLSLENSFHLDRFSMAAKSRYGMGTVTAVRIMETTPWDNNRGFWSCLKYAPVPYLPSPGGLTIERDSLISAPLSAVELG